MIGQVARGQVLLEGAVGKGVDAHPACGEQAGPVAHVLDHTRRLDIGVRSESYQAAHKALLADVRGSGQVRLVAVRLERQVLQQLAHRGPVHLQPLAQARLDHDGLAVRPAHQLGAFPLVEQQVHRVRVQLLALLGQVSPAPGMQAGHQGQQQRPLGQFGQPLAAPDRVFEQRRTALRVVWVLPAHCGQVCVPTVYEALDLRGAERSQHCFAEAVQLPILALVGVRPAGHDEAAAREVCGKPLHCLLDLDAPLAGVGHLVKPIQHHQPAGLAQLPLEMRLIVRQRLAQLAGNEAPQVIAGRAPPDRRQAACGEVPQDHAHRQQRAMAPRLGCR